MINAKSGKSTFSSIECQRGSVGQAGSVPHFGKGKCIREQVRRAREAGSRTRRRALDAGGKGCYKPLRRVEPREIVS